MNDRSPPLAILLALSFAAQLPAQRAIVHPTRENLEVSGVTHEIGRHDTQAKSPLLDRLAQRLRRAHRVDSIGTLDGEIETVIGIIRDAVVTNDGDILIVDRANASVRAFGSDGRFKFSVGREGSGPTDLRTPIAAWRKPNGDLAVVDVTLGLKSFTIAKNGIASLRDVSRIRVGYSACFTGGKIFALEPSVGLSYDGANDGSTVRVYDVRGKLLSTFGNAYKSPARIARLAMSEGVLGCAADATVLVAQSWLPFVRSYSADGKLRWTIKFSDYTVGRHLQRPNQQGHMSIMLDPDNPTSSYTLRIRELSPGYAAIQVGLMTPSSIRDRSIWERVDTYLVETDTGRGLYVSSSLPLLAGMKGNRLVGYRNDPYPQVEILQIP